MMTIETILMVVLGGALCLFGFALYMGTIHLIGLVLGGILGAVAGATIADLAKLEGTTALLALVGGALIGAIVGWFLFELAQRILIILVGIGLGLYVGRTLVAGLGGTWAQPWVPLVTAVIGGLLFALLWKYAIILVTVMVGASLLYQVFQKTWVWVAAVAVGLVVQFGAYIGLGLHRRARF
jgi:hypothetical protein